MLRVTLEENVHPNGMTIQMTCQNNTKILKPCTSRSGQLSQLALDVTGVRLPASED